MYTQEKATQLEEQDSLTHQRIQISGDCFFSTAEKILLAKMRMRPRGLGRPPWFVLRVHEAFNLRHTIEGKVWINIQDFLGKRMEEE